MLSMLGLLPQKCNADSEIIIIGGHAVGLNLSIKYLFGIHGQGDVMFCASDLGWVVGHSYILYAPCTYFGVHISFLGGNLKSWDLY